MQRPSRIRPAAQRRLAAVVTGIAMLVPAAMAQASSGGAGISSAPTKPRASGGAAIGGLAPVTTQASKLPTPPSKHSRGRWLGGTTVTEYWPAPEAWFTGKLVSVSGLTGKHRIDWLYSATGVSMEGEGLGLDGRLYHINALGNGGWVTVGAQSTTPADGWSAGSPFWRDGGYWLGRHGGVTYPLQAGGWSAGAGRKYVPLPGVSFAAGASLPLKFLQSVAVDPSVIPLGSRVYIPAYRADGYGGWFVAQDTGGAINGHHVDVYRRPPASSTDSGQYLTRQRIYVIKPHRR
jgi:3D (Asp-Asp-Asp) domain-containing protein